MTKNTYVRVKINPTGEFVWVDKDSLYNTDGDGTKVLNNKGEYVNLQELAFTELSENDDLDTLIEHGAYRVANWGLAQNVPNLPVQEAGILYVYSGNGANINPQPIDAVTQRYETEHGDIWIRRKIYNTVAPNGWSEWQKVLTTADEIESGVEVVEISESWEDFITLGFLNFPVPKINVEQANTIRALRNAGKMVLIKYNGATYPVLGVAQLWVSIFFTIMSSDYILQYNAGMEPIVTKLPQVCSGSSITVDSELSDTSTNPVQNKVIKEALDGKVDGWVADYSKIDSAYQASNELITVLAQKADGTYIPIYVGRYGDTTKQSIVVRNPAGQIVTASPTSDSACTPKKYVDDTLENKVDKYTGSAGLNRLYGVDSNGNETTFIVASSDKAASPGRVPYYRDTSGAGATKPKGTLIVDDPVQPYAATHKKYVDDALNNKLDKQTGDFSVGSTRGYVYFVNPFNEQAMKKLTTVADSDSIPLRNASGNFYVGTPTLQYECTPKGYVDDALDNKLDKITSTGASRVYTVNGQGVQGTVNYGQTPVASWLPLYEPSQSGALQVGTPLKPAHAIPLSYAQENFSPKLYRHNIVLNYAAGAQDYIIMRIEVINTSAELITTYEAFCESGLSITDGVLSAVGRVVTTNNMKGVLTCDINANNDLQIYGVVGNSNGEPTYIYKEFTADQVNNTFTITDYRTDL